MRVGRRRSFYLVTLAPLAAATLLGVGCGQLLGLGDYTDGKAPAAKCSEGTADCDDNHEDCETDTTRDKANCGACGKKCSEENASSTSCKDGECVVECKTGFADCDEDPSNGCEADLQSDADHCGTCEKKCVATNAMSATCAFGKCALDCDAHWGDCDGDPGNGCEQDLNIHKSDCGACGQVCADDNTSAAACVDSTCMLTCNAGFDDCNKMGSDGCETDLMTDVDSCGACGEVCAPINATAACVGGKCDLTCLGGKLDCDGDGSNGCEVDPGVDQSNCGSCGHVCEGTCAYVCKPVTLVSGWDPGPKELLVGPMFAYFPAMGAVAKVPIQGGQTTGMATTAGIPRALAMSSTFLFWFDPTNGYLLKTALPNGGATISITYAGDITSMAADDNGVFWTNDTAKEVQKLNGGAYVTLASLPGETFGRIAIDANNVYFATTGLAGRVWSVPRDGLGQAQESCKTGAEKPTSLALDTNNVYFGTTSSALYAIGKDGLGFASLGLTQSPPTMLTTDGVDLYWTDALDGQILRTSVAGGGVDSVLAMGQDIPTGIFLTATNIYWTNVGSAPSTGAIMKLEKNP